MVSAVPPCELLLAVLLERVRDVSEQVSWLTRAPQMSCSRLTDGSGGGRNGRLLVMANRSISVR